MSSRLQNRRPRSCTHSKYETVTPPALQRMSGSTGSRARRRSRPPPARSGRSRPRRSFGLTRGAFSPVTWSSSAAGTRMSHSSSSSSSFVMCSPSYLGERGLAVLEGMAVQRLDVEPLGRRGSRRKVADADHRRAALVQLQAATPPTFPNPWTTHRCSASPSRAGAARRRPSRRRGRSPPAGTEPPILIGLPVTISGTA